MSNDTSMIALASTDTTLIDDLAHLTYTAFVQHAPTWLPTPEDARRQVLKALEPTKILGFTIVGVIPDAEGRGKPGISLAKRID